MNNNLLKPSEKLTCQPSIIIKPVKKRWIILTIYVYYTCFNCLQFIEYASISNLVVKYYKVSTIAADWTSTIYLAAYPLLAIPVSYIIEKKGLRLAGLIGCIGTFIATFIKIFSVGTNLFWVLMLGQTVAAVSQLFIMCLPPKIASIWFKENEVSTACSLGVFGYDMGYLLAYILPTSLVHDSDNLNDIGEGLKILCWVLAALMAPVTILALLCFPDEPKYPPNQAQATLRQIRQSHKFQKISYLSTLKSLLANKGFVIHLLAYSINFSIANVIIVFWSQLVLQYFPGAEQDVGWMGFGFIVAAMVGTIIFGLILDKTRKYKQLNLLINVCQTIAFLLVMLSLKFESKIAVYLTICLFGFFAGPYVSAGYEFNIELTYPLDECTSMSMVMASVQTCGTVLIVSSGYLMQVMDTFHFLVVYLACLVVGTVILLYVPDDLRRQQAFRPVPRTDIDDVIM
ncbi:unnamed protein product [Phyllotreta striolata]|uniref:Major facilitator superfamily (MFS) profile domain-containing protein n=1 Tax=Phyllotreta striolata TaxID=444603 RepID=A0A9N9XPL1_PHYSR|nr:unnamed protein product [Phyllotreta striolata]